MDMGLRMIPFRHYALARYHAARPSIINELIPLNSRAQKLHAEFRKMLAQGHPDTTSSPLCFVPGTVLP